jgi:hypothetical protein
VECPISLPFSLTTVFTAPVNFAEMHNLAFKKLGLNYAYLAFEVGNEQLEDVVTGMRAVSGVSDQSAVFINDCIHRAGEFR